MDVEEDDPIVDEVRCHFCHLISIDRFITLNNDRQWAQIDVFVSNGTLASQLYLVREHRYLCDSLLIV